MSVSLCGNLAVWGEEEAVIKESRMPTKGSLDHLCRHDRLPWGVGGGERCQSSQPAHLLIIVAGLVGTISRWTAR